MLQLGAGRCAGAPMALARRADGGRRGAARGRGAARSRLARVDTHRTSPLRRAGRVRAASTGARTPRLKNKLSLTPHRGNRVCARRARARGLLAARPVLDRLYGLYIPLGAPDRAEFLLAAAVLAAAALISLVPALRAYRMSLADGMMVRF